MKATIGDAAISACENICEDNLTDYLDNLMSSADGSLLDDYDEENMRVRLLPLLKYSTAYAVLTRLPDLKLPTETNYPLGKYAMMRLEYLKRHRRGTYTTLLTQAKLNEHLHEVEESAKEQISMTISRMAQNLGVTEQMKATDPMKWVQTMNGLKAAAEEEVLNSLIFA